jgi:hypothetical protein
VTYPGFTPVGNATLVVANVLTCNKHSPKLREGGVITLRGATGMSCVVLQAWHPLDPSHQLPVRLVLLCNIMRHTVMWCVLLGRAVSCVQSDSGAYHAVPCCVCREQNILADRLASMSMEIDMEMITFVL